MPSRPAGTLLLLCLYACSAGLTFRPETTELGSEPELLPTRTWGGYFLIEARMEGYGPYLFLLDTGADCMLVSPEIALRLSHRHESTESSILGANGETATSTGALRVENLELGSTTLSGFRALVMDVGPLAEALGTHIDGVLGLPLFADCLLTLDYRARQVWVSPGALDPVDHREILPLAPDGVGEIDASIGDRAITFKIDSGFSRQIGLPSRLGLEFAHGPRPGSDIVTIAGTHPQSEGVLADDLHLGRHVIRHPSAAINGGSPKLGADLLRRFVITFDQRNDRVRFW